MKNKWIFRVNKVSKLLFILVKNISFILDRSKKKGGQLPPVPPPAEADLEWGLLGLQPHHKVLNQNFL